MTSDALPCNASADASRDSAVLRADLPVTHALGFTTTRRGGHSLGCFDSWNLGDHVGDSAYAVNVNRKLLADYLPCSTMPRWLKQVHSNRVVAAHAVSDGIEADAAWTDRPGIACVVMTADCLPILLACDGHPWVAAVHGGWRGLAGGIIEATLNSCTHTRGSLHAWLGPAIGPTVFEVGDDVVQAFTQRYGASMQRHFQPVDRTHWLANLYGIASQILADCGVTSVTGGGLCTYRDATRFFSYRRDGQTGRMASVIALPPAS
jgi:YfiH family protein